MKALVLQKMVEQGLNELVGGGDPESIGNENFSILRNLAELNSDMDILDFGCGCGRLSLPVLDYLSKDGSYVGVDIVPRLIEFCNTEIAKHYYNASFFKLNASNKLYDKFFSDVGKALPEIDSLSDLGSKKFDLIAAFSVFTHLTLEEAIQYLTELSALLKPGGKLVMSCFLINESSRYFVKAGMSLIKFSNEVLEDRDVYYTDIKGQLYAVGFQEHKLIELARIAGLDPSTIYYGHWCGRGRRKSFQDVFILTDNPRLPDGFDAIRYMEKNADLPWAHNDEGAISATEHYLNHGYYEMRDW